MVYIYEQPEWAAMVVGKDSPITDPRELKGKKVAATKGTDPYFFLLRTLNANGLSQADVEVVNLQHDQGRLALERGQVDAWAGLDPHMAASELEAGSRLIYRNKDFNTYGFLNGREAFLSQYPDATKKVIEVYERARAWTIENPEEAAKILAEESSVSIEVARRELFERMNLKASAVPGDEHVAALKAVIPIMTAEKLVKDGSDPEKALTGSDRAQLRKGRRQVAMAVGGMRASRHAVGRSRADRRGHAQRAAPHLDQDAACRGCCRWCCWCCGSCRSRLGIFRAHQLPPPLTVLSTAFDQLRAGVLPQHILATMGARLRRLPDRLDSGAGARYRRRPARAASTAPSIRRCRPCAPSPRWPGRRCCCCGSASTSRPK